MTDSLDDFFAKKDKKRGKDRGKAVISAEALVKELEEGSKQTDYSVRKDNKISTAIEILGLDADDADWRDFEDVEKKDYTGLKVKEMSIQDQTEEEQRRLASEQIETTPDATAWKTKDETISAISSEPSSIAADPAPNENADDGSRTGPASVETQEQQDETKQSGGADDEATNSSSSKPNTSDAASSAKKVGDTTTKSSGKYVPPSERKYGSSEVGVRELEPIKLSKLKGMSSRQSANIDIQDTCQFPSLG